MMHTFVLGQRWMSEAEPEMGLGTVLSIEGRAVTVGFPMCEQRRRYAVHNAPLQRYELQIGDQLTTREGMVGEVADVQDLSGLLVYKVKAEDGEFHTVLESNLNDSVVISQPQDRLLSGQVDADKWFKLRYKAHLHKNKIVESETYGLGGGRIGLIPHQLYIAHEVASRYRPRVLLADEVGLGKTIEAGMIIHHQVLTGRAQRILIIVPEALQNQWLVEMLRRFNLMFSIVDLSRCMAVEEETPGANPFSSVQYALCSLEFLQEDEQFQKHLKSAGWDMLVVDEAHHLSWSEDYVSDAYQLVESLTQQIPAVLLLTATPEQLGKAGHFARLRLLDPDRFSDYASFIKEEQNYQPIAEAAQVLLEHEKLTEDQFFSLKQLLKGHNEAQTVLENYQRSEQGREAGAMDQLIQWLLDFHGTGRLLFRNTRHAVKGFPERQVHSYVLESNPQWTSYLQSLQRDDIPHPQLILSPEILYQCDDANTVAWQSLDPRCEWLMNFLKEHRHDKVLVIASSADTALDLSEYLRVKSGIHAAVFHEGQSILERDRGAAFFADMEDGSQVLLCSEIGSEGRNFQFAHHLVMFDIPWDPDLLEQRIGRLDRIGQTETVQIHVPLLQGTGQINLFRWYDEALNAFEKVSPAASTVTAQHQQDLETWLIHPDKNGDKLIAHGLSVNQQLTAEMHKGRDRLLELNSCRTEVATPLLEQIEAQDNSSQLPVFLNDVYECFGVDSEVHSDYSLIIRPGNHMHDQHFPGLPEDGMVITYSREHALVHEDRAFMHWEHPQVQEILELILGSTEGNVAMVVLPKTGLLPGTLLLEAIYHIQVPRHSKMAPIPELNEQVLRIVVNLKGTDFAKSLEFEVINNINKRIDRHTARQILKSQSKDVAKLISIAQTQAEKQAKPLLAMMQKKAQRRLDAEIDRLEYLASLNPSVRADEIEVLNEQKQQLDSLMQSVRIRQDALRLLVCV